MEQESRPAFLEVYKPLGCSAKLSSRPENEMKRSGSLEDQFFTYDVL